MGKKGEFFSPFNSWKALSSKEIFFLIIKLSDLFLRLYYYWGEKWKYIKAKKITKEILT